jgi:hypothetical protein
MSHAIREVTAMGIFLILFGLLGIIICFTVMVWVFTAE